MKAKPCLTRYQFSCHLCGQKFTQRGGLDNHLMLHAGNQKAQNTNVKYKKPKIQIHKTKSPKYKYPDDQKAKDLLECVICVSQNLSGLVWQEE